ncbi:hypothetical protein AZE42_10414 [Rhizopogon vesiculosus]|uniref:Brain protein I3 n=1 Tax=Rhizopogon vesiculosus TaxID=180088 RepID=A0A1J8PY06_9AGAM|nr:hypothetical protein AZE42_10414 [Rhizopogon vesiculosus]
MIIDSQSNMVSSSTDNPPSYDFVAAQTSSNEQSPSSPEKGANSSVQRPPISPVTAVHNRPAPAMQQPTVYHYQNPMTGEHVASLLPPDHPEMVCLQQGGHINETKFGILGILAAIIWFPLGIGLCLLDRRVKCRRCGEIIEDRICG